MQERNFRKKKIYGKEILEKSESKDLHNHKAHSCALWLAESGSSFTKSGPLKAHYGIFTQKDCNL